MSSWLKAAGVWKQIGSTSSGGGGGGGTTPPPVGTAYRPVRVTMTATTSAARIAELNTQGLHLPTDATLVVWPYSAPDTVRLNVWLDTLGANDIGVLPEFVDSFGAPKPYLIESSGGFIRDASHYFWMASMTRGLVGLGPNTVVTTASSSYTEGQQPTPFIDPYDGTTKVGCQYKVINCSTPNPYLGNLEFRGRSFGGVAYNGVAFNKGIQCLENVYFNACHRGFKNSPNGEAGAWTCKGGPVTWARNFEVECRDSGGARVASSPWMLNSLTGALIEDAYGHHSIAGMPTCWTVNSTVANPVIFRRVRSEWNGSGGGGLNGSCFNFELCQGTFSLYDCTLICNYLGNTDSAVGTGNSELHVSGGSDVAKATINLYNPAIDRGPVSAAGTVTGYTTTGPEYTLAFQLFGYSPQYGLSVNRYSSGGALLPVRQYGTITA